MLMEQLLRIMPGTLVLTEGILGAPEMCKICIIICYLFTVDRKTKCDIFCLLPRCNERLVWVNLHIN